MIYFFTHLLSRRNLQNTMEAAPEAGSMCRSGLTGPGSSEPSSNLNLLSTAVMLRERHGMSIFVQGLTPKMMQAGVNHSVTFYIYDLIVNTFSP